jgi:hypothetical protein
MNILIVVTNSSVKTRVGSSIWVFKLCLVGMLTSMREESYIFQIDCLFPGFKTLFPNNKTSSVLASYGCNEVQISTNIIFN